MTVNKTFPAFLGPQCIQGTDTWQRVNTGMPVKSPRFAIFDLAEGKSYNFRVRCCNSAGVGEPSVPTGEIIVGDKLGELTKLAAITLQALHTEKPVASLNR